MAGAAVATPVQALPHLDSVQRAFGHHDISHVRAHLGDQASTASARLGARAFTTGNDVVFRGQPDVQLVAHEAAHVIQQRAGAGPDGGVGHAGDRFEQHADRVADAVGRGESAEALLDEYAAPATVSPRGPVQRLVDANPPSILVGAYDASPLTSIPPLGNPDDIGSKQSMPRAKAVTVPNGAQTFLTKARSIDPAGLQAVNAARTALDADIQAKGGAIDAALARDKARGARIDPGLETAINSYKAATSRVSGSSKQIDGLRTQVSGLTHEAGGLVAGKAAQEKKEQTQEEENAAKAKAKEDIASAYTNLTAIEGAAVDTLGAIIKVRAKVDEPVGGVVDIAGAWIKIALQYWNQAKQDADTQEALAKIKASFADAKNQINASNAAAFNQQVGGIKTQIAGVKTQIEGVTTTLLADLKLAGENMATIMKAKSSAAALAAIQDFMRSVTAHGDAVRTALGQAAPVVSWDHAATGGQLYGWLKNQLSEAEGAASQWMNRKPSEMPPGMAESLVRLEADLHEWETRTNALAAWTLKTQGWFAAQAEELKAQQAFVSGPHLAKGEQALTAIASLGER
ncbi:MAG TPA: DUF4157 domain-containing protein [Kofleriaceae bacterium]